MSARGQVLCARYRLVRAVDADQQTEVWEADDLTLERRVLLTLSRAVGADDAADERFWASARAAAHPAGTDAPRVLDAGTDPATGQAFLVREWAEPPADVPPATPEPPLAVRPAEPRQRWRNDARGRWTDWRPGRWAVVGGVAAALAIGGFFTGAGVTAWLAWINEPFAQSRAAFSLPFPPAVQAPPAVGAQPGQATATPPLPPPTVAPAARPPSQPTPTANARTTATATPTPPRRPPPASSPVGTASSTPTAPAWRCAAVQAAPACKARATTRA